MVTVQWAGAGGRGVALEAGTGGGGRVPMDSSTQHSDPQRPKRSSASARTTDAKGMGTSSVRSYLFVYFAACSFNKGAEQS